jgi:hypothetical protein
MESLLMDENRRRNKLPHGVIVRAPGLLPMLYSPRELSEDLQIPESTLRDWLQAGAPHQRDGRSRLWINGEQFSAWVKAQQKPKAVRKLAADEAYCLHCKRVTRLESPKRRHIKGNLVHIKGLCLYCGRKINRGDRYDRTTKLPEN